MTIKEFFDILKENYCKSGEYDKNGFYRSVTGGNELYLVNNKGGWAYVCTLIKGYYMGIVKYSIKPDGTMKNEGKLSEATMKNIHKSIESATKYAIITPENQSLNNVIKWIDIK